MGRIFETRKHTMFARWDRMAKQFARIGKEITIAVRVGGPDPENNPQLRRVIQNARSINMPMEKVETAIDRASGKGATDYEEVLYEGYAPHGVAILIETATDNSTRTVANLRTHFNKGGGNLANSGSVGFLFQRKGVFRLDPAGLTKGLTKGHAKGLADGLDRDELELALIDHGLEELSDGESEKGEAQLVLHCAFSDFGLLQRGLEERGITPLSGESEYLPTTMVALPEEAEAEVLKLVDRLEQDEDVQKVFHNLA